MSRFFAAAGSSSSSDNDSSLSEDDFINVKESQRSTGLFEALSISSSKEDDSFEEGDGFGSEEDYSEGDEEGDEHATAAPLRKSRFDFATDSESEEEESTQRQVKSQKEKARAEMENLVDSIDAGCEEADWISVQEDYDRLIKLMNKFEGVCVPSVAYLVLVDLEKSINQYAQSAELKDLKVAVAKAFNALRQKVRKAISRYADQIQRAETHAEDEQMEEDDQSLDSSLASTNKSITEPTKAVELTLDNMLKRLQEIISSRGRKHVDKHENVATLRKMLSISQNRRHKAHVLGSLIVTNLELAGGNLGYIPIEAFTSLINELLTLNSLLAAEEEDGPWVDLKPDEEEHGLTIMSGVRSTMISYAQRVDDEFIKALQNTDPHSNEYIEYLRVEPLLYSLLEKCYQTLTRLPDQGELLCQIIVRQLEHIYYKPREIVAKYFVDKGQGQLTVPHLVRHLYEKGGEKQKCRALLFHAYWLAIHDCYLRSRDLILQSHVQDHLSSLDIPTQILYNRTVVQVGLAAFRAGYLKETYFALQELCSTGRPKELLAQGLVGQKYTEKGDMDRLERQRIVPFHMQINVEMIDCIFLTVSMLLEIPQNAAAARRYFHGERRLFNSRHLRRIMDGHDRSLFSGPPENTRECVIAAAKALANGHWRECEAFMMKIKLWDLLPNPVAIRNLLKHKIRESGLYAFVYSAASCYTALSTERLARHFDLPLSVVVRIVARLIGDFGVPATISEDQRHVMWKPDCDPSPSQELVLQLKEKIQILDERNNETADLLNSIHHSQARNLRNQEAISYMEQQKDNNPSSNSSSHHQHPEVPPISSS